MKDFTHPKFPTIHIKLLSPETDITLLETLLADSPLQATEVFEFIPQGLSTDEKYLYGIFDETTLVGIIDVIEDYPVKQSAFINEFFIREDLLDSTLSETLYLALEKTAQETGITSMEINQDLTTLPFLETVGFVSHKKNI